VVEEESYEDLGSPIFRDSQGFFFHDESWSYVSGPYETKEQAEEACNAYAIELEESR